MMLKRPRQERQQPTATLVVLLLIALVTSTTTKKESKKQRSESKEKSSLVFEVQCQLVSEPFCDDPKALRQFLAQPHVRNLFLSAGGQRPFQELSIDIKDKDKDGSLVSLWRQACERYYGLDALPEALQQESVDRQSLDMDDIAVLSTETEAKFPGFKTINTVVNGCRRFESDSANEIVVPKTGFLSFCLGKRQKQERGDIHLDGHPADNKDILYKFYLIADKKRMEGPSAVVWLVKKLMGEEGFFHGTKSYSSSETQAISKVSIYVQKPWEDIEKSENGGAAPMVGFRLDIDCTIRIEFPRLLLKLLPASRSKVEARGTKAIRKALLKDATMAVESVQRAWWKERQQEECTLQSPSLTTRNRRGAFSVLRRGESRNP